MSTEPVASSTARRDVVLRRDQADLVALALVLGGDQVGDLGVGGAQVGVGGAGTCSLQGRVRGACAERQAIGASVARADREARARVVVPRRAPQPRPRARRRAARSPRPRRRRRGCRRTGRGTAGRTRRRPAARLAARSAADGVGGGRRGGRGEGRHDVPPARGPPSRGQPAHRRDGGRVARSGGREDDRRVAVAGRDAASASRRSSARSSSGSRAEHVGLLDVDRRGRQLRPGCRRRCGRPPRAAGARRRRAGERCATTSRRQRLGRGRGSSRARSGRAAAGGPRPAAPRRCRAAAGSRLPCATATGQAWVRSRRDRHPRTACRSTTSPMTTTAGGWTSRSRASSAIVASVPVVVRWSGR